MISTVSMNKRHIKWKLVVYMWQSTSKKIGITQSISIIGKKCTTIIMWFLQCLHIACKKSYSQ